MQAYTGAGTRTEEQVQGMIDALKEFTGLVLRGAGTELIDKLNEGQMVQIVQVFMTEAGWTVADPPTRTPSRRTRRTTGT